MTAAEQIQALAHRLPELGWQEALRRVNDDATFDAEAIWQAIKELEPDWAQEIYERARGPVEIEMDDVTAISELVAPAMTVNDMIGRLLALRARDPAIGNMRMVLLVGHKPWEIIGVHLQYPDTMLTLQDRPIP